MTKLCKGLVTEKITSDFILDLYEEAKKKKGKEKKKAMDKVKSLSKMIGSYLISIDKEDGQK